jgi:hypothetical protein
MASKPTPRQSADNQQRKSNAMGQLYQSEKRVAQNARAFSDQLNEMGFNPAEQALFQDPKVGRILLNGGEINGIDIPDAIRTQLGIGRTQRVSLPPHVLQQFQGGKPRLVSGPSPDLMPNLQPINSLGELINPHSITPSTAGLEEIIAQLNNHLNELKNKTMINAQTAGPLGFGAGITNPNVGTDVGAVDVNPIAGTGTRQSPDILSRLFSQEGRGITMNEIMSAVRGILPKSTTGVDETSIMDAASRAFPELAQRDKSMKAKKGLQRFSGAGIFKVGGNKYKIEGSKIIKVG